MLPPFIKLIFAEFYDYCTSLDKVEETFTFDKNTLVFKKKNKIFALANTFDFEFINLKCYPIETLELREKYHGIRPGYHMNKKHWNSVYINQDVPDALIYELIRKSYLLV